MNISTKTILALTLTLNFSSAFAAKMGRLDHVETLQVGNISAIKSSELKARTLGHPITGLDENSNTNRSLRLLCTDVDVKNCQKFRFVVAAEYQLSVAQKGQAPQVYSGYQQIRVVADRKRPLDNRELFNVKMLSHNDLYSYGETIGALAASGPHRYFSASAEGAELGYSSFSVPGYIVGVGAGLIVDALKAPLRIVSNAKRSAAYAKQPKNVSPKDARNYNKIVQLYSSEDLPKATFSSGVFNAVVAIYESRARASR